MLEPEEVLPRDAMPQCADCIITAVFYTLGVMSVLAPYSSWEKLLRPTCIVSGALAGAFSSIAGTVYAFNRYLLWYPVHWKATGRILGKFYHIFPA